MTQRTEPIPASTLELLKKALANMESQALYTAQQTQGISLGPIPTPANAVYSARTRYGRVPTLAQRRSFANGDHWGPNGLWWTGLRPGTGSNLTMDDLERLFIQDDRIGPAIDRRVSAILGKDPEFSGIREDAADAQQPEGKPQPDPELDAIEDALSEWWRDAEIHKTLKIGLRFQQWARYCCFRINIPQAFAEQARHGSAKSLEEALEIIDVQAIDPTQAEVLRDEHGRTVGYFYIFSDVDEHGDTVPMVELHTPEWIALYKLPNLEPAATVPNPLFDPKRRRRPRFQMWRLEREQSVISQGIIDKNSALNEEWSNLKRNSQLGAFRQYIIKNAQQLKDPVTGKLMDYTFGPSIVLELFGVPELDQQNGLPTGRLNTVDVQVVEPVNPQTFLATIDHLAKSIDGDFDQAWAHENNLRVSGASKQEARAAFEKGIILEGPALVEQMRWMLETVLALAAWLQGKPDLYAGIAFNPRLYLEVSRGNLELFTALIPAYAAGLVSIETVIESNPGVVDATEELDRIEQEKADRQAEAAGRTDALNALMNAPPASTGTSEGATGQPQTVTGGADTIGNSSGSTAAPVAGLV